MKHLLLAMLAPLSLLAQGGSTSRTGDFSVHLRIAPPVKLVELYEVPQAWGCTLRVGDQCFASMARITEEPANEKPLVGYSIPALVYSPVWILSEHPDRRLSAESAGWVLYAIRLMYPEMEFK